MNIVLLESLGVPDEVLNACAKPLIDAGHTFKAYPKDTDPKVQIERAKDADVIMIANMPLSGEVISACPNLKYIDVPSPVWIMWTWKLPRPRASRFPMPPAIPMRLCRNSSSA